MSFKSALIAAMVAAGSAQAAIVITEAHPTGSSSSTYAADWFELTNTGNTDVDITGWRVDDNSNAFGSSVALRRLTVIPAGKSVIFMETASDDSNGNAKIAAFIDAWFGGLAPAGFLIGTYGGSGIGLSSGGDALNIFTAAGALVHNISFGGAFNGITFSNPSGASGLVNTLSSVGVNGAFTSVAGGEVGSPGLIPTPGAVALLGVAGLVSGRRRRA
ncbi:MAG: lamin tail domain-containing protein [Planctomycetota bacterium]|nr:lamin tail domain-containing protein [Planctomycetota bacterium]